ncbi:MAG: OmpH family outer membrane protein [Firmicutes bacterium]|nr:OmpH family outer membrane protein [Bacillota bacterium]
MNNKNNNWILSGAIIIGALIIAAGLVWGINSFSFKLATVDVQKIQMESALSKKINEDVQTKGNDLSAKFQSAKTDKDKQAINLEFEKYKKEKQQEFTDKVIVALEKVAKKKGYKAVATDQVYLYSRNNITDEVIKELDQ